MGGCGGLFSGRRNWVQCFKKTEAKIDLNRDRIGGEYKEKNERNNKYLKPSENPYENILP